MPAFFAYLSKHLKSITCQVKKKIRYGALLNNIVFILARSIVTLISACKHCDGGCYNYVTGHTSKFMYALNYLTFIFQECTACSHKKNFFNEIYTFHYFEMQI